MPGHALTARPRLPYEQTGFACNGHADGGDPPHRLDPANGGPVLAVQVQGMG